jgi:hypothetical protein
MIIIKECDPVECRFCFEPVKEKFTPCKCTSSIHKECLNNYFKRNGKTTCDVCKFEYNLITVPTYCGFKCSKSSNMCCNLLNKFVKGIIWLFAGLFVGLFVIIVVVIIISAIIFACAPENILELLGDYKLTEYWSLNHHVFNYLFPNKNNDSFLITLIYTIAYVICVLSIPSLFDYLQNLQNQQNQQNLQNQQNQQNQKNQQNQQNQHINYLKILLVVFLCILGIAVLHLLGNVHFCFYSAFGIIPKYDRFHMSGETFGASGAGIILIIVPILIIYGIIKCGQKIIMPYDNCKLCKGEAYVIGNA